MTNHTELQGLLVSKLREHAGYLKHNIAGWQLLAKAANEIERLQAEVNRLTTLFKTD